MPRRRGNEAPPPEPDTPPEWESDPDSDNTSEVPRNESDDDDGPIGLDDTLSDFVG